MTKKKKITKEMKKEKKIDVVYLKISIKWHLRQEKEQ